MAAIRSIESGLCSQICAAMARGCRGLRGPSIDPRNVQVIWIRGNTALVKMPPSTSKDQSYQPAYVLMVTLAWRTEAHRVLVGPTRLVWTCTTRNPAEYEGRAGYLNEIRMALLIKQAEDNNTADEETS